MFAVFPLLRFLLFINISLVVLVRLAFNVCVNKNYYKGARFSRGGPKRCGWPGSEGTAAGGEGSYGRDGVAEESRKSLV